MVLEQLCRHLELQALALENAVDRVVLHFLGQNVSVNHDPLIFRLLLALLQPYCVVLKAQIASSDQREGVDVRFLGIDSLYLETENMLAAEEPVHVHFALQIAARVAQLANAMGVVVEAAHREGRVLQVRLRHGLEGAEEWLRWVGTHCSRHMQHDW